MSPLRFIIQPSEQLSELDLKSSSVYVSSVDDLGTTFCQKLEASAVSERKQVVLTRCTDFLKELLVQYQMRFPASMALLLKLKLLCPTSVLFNRSLVQELPRSLYFAHQIHLRLTEEMLPQQMSSLTLIVAGDRTFSKDVKMLSGFSTCCN